MSNTESFERRLNQIEGGWECLNQTNMALLSCIEKLEAEVADLAIRNEALTLAVGDTFGELDRRLSETFGLADEIVEDVDERLQNVEALVQPDQGAETPHDDLLDAFLFAVLGTDRRVAERRTRNTGGVGRPARRDNSTNRRTTNQEKQNAS